MTNREENRINNSDTFNRFNSMLENLRESHELSVSEEVKTGNSDTERYLIFMLGSESFAMNIGQLQEVLIARAIVPIPKAPASVHGIINHKNRILAVINIHYLLQMPFKRTDDPYLIAVRRRGKSAIVLLVDRLVNLMTIDNRDIKPGISGQMESVDKLIKGEIYIDERLITLLDLDDAV